MEVVKDRNFVLFCLIFNLTQLTACGDASKHISFVTDYINWRKIHYLIILDHWRNPGSNIQLAKENLNTFVDKNIYFTVHTSVKHSQKTLNQTKHKTAIVTYFEANFSSDDVLEKANKICYFGENVAWLIIANCYMQKTLMNALRYANFGLNVDIVVALIPHFQKHNNSNDTDCVSMLNQQELFLPFRSNTSECVDYCSNLYKSRNANQESYSLHQVYKIRKDANTSLVVHPLGIWDAVNSTKNLVPFWYYESRRNFHKFPLLIGTIDKHGEGVVKESVIDPRNKHFASYFSNFFNSSKKFSTYSKIGYKENEGWTDLLEAITDENIDLSSDGIAITLDKYEDMLFSFTILRNWKNIYIEPEKSEIMHNIFLVPFESRLLFCVVGTGLILSVIITLNNFIDYKFCSKDIQTRNKSFAESIVWCIGVFSQQGSIWKTKSYSQKIIVLISLMFTLLIYNSYSAFITSVLSVELHSIRSVSDLLESDYMIGYTKDSPDEDYLRFANNSDMKQIYLRGYLQTSINNISEGLSKVIKGNYGLFASGQDARLELRNITKCRCKFDIDEINIQYTVENLGIVMPKRSPYKRLINLSIIRMYETGVYKYIYSIIYPELQKCVKPTTYQSARLVDLSTAFFILSFGWCVSFSLIILECLWKRKKRIYINLKRRLESGNQVNIIGNDIMKRSHPHGTNFIWSTADKKRVLNFNN